MKNKTNRVFFLVFQFNLTNFDKTSLGIEEKTMYALPMWKKK